MAAVNYIGFLLIVAGFNAGLLIVSEKYGWTAKYEYYRPPWLPQRCEFCACFWSAVGVASFALVYMPGVFNWLYLYPLCFPVAAYSITIYKQ